MKKTVIGKNEEEYQEREWQVRLKSDQNAGATDLHCATNSSCTNNTRLASLAFFLCNT